MNTKHKKFPKEEKSGEVSKLKRRIKRLEKENERLRSENKTLEAYKDLTNEYIGDNLDGIPVERVIKSVEKEQKLKKVVNDSKPKCPTCGTEGMTIIETPHNVTHLCKLCNYLKVDRNGQKNPKRENN
jgi:regulator of replication initiation timing